MADSGRSQGHPAELATLRILLLGVAVAVIFSAVVTSAVADPRGRVELPGWLVALTTSAFAVLLVVGVAAPWLGARALRRGAATGVALFFAALVLFAPVSGALTGTGSGGTLPWALTTFGGFAVAAVVAGGARLGWTSTVVWVCLVVLYRLLLGGYSMIGLANDAQALMTAAALCVIAAHALRTSRELDAAAGRAEQFAAEQGAARGRLAARARVAAFVHDEVLAALRGAAEYTPDTATAVQSQARRAAAMIDADRDVSDWIEQLRAMAADAGADLQINCVPQALVPRRDVAEAMLIATRQALDNSVRHAGPCRRSVRLEVGGSDLLLRIADDGIGFSAESIRPGRMGVTASIVGAMRDVAGGTGRVTSEPKHGTTVELRWAEASDGEDDDVAGTPGPTLDGDRVGAFVATVLFVATQTLVAVAASVTVTDSWWMPLLILAGILVSAALTLPSLPAPTIRNVATVVLACVTVLLGLLATPAPLTYGSAWFLPAAGFVLVAVALNARPVLAICGLVVMLAMLLTHAALRDGEAVQLVSVGVRTATTVGLGTLLSVAIVRLRRSTRALARRAVTATEQREWDAAARHELEDHAAAMDDLAGPFLSRVAAGHALDAAGRARARGIEGRLRDGYRAGRLLDPALIDAAMRARTRGVDVVLLDDAGDGRVEPATATAVAAWMRVLLDEADNRFVGRLLPPDRPWAAQVLVDDRAQTYHG
ncbi:ATP-binding protein [Nocardioides gilvus]|uniref:ATP-binding protein n=1 Tax=Nocardioides gilvus TaxID=1735589 RepID=UPI000D74F0F3|nr:ATP-binding protein [Nocardioides gilvus]